jgi:hypothetical protein
MHCFKIMCKLERRTIATFLENKDPQVQVVEYEYKLSTS